MIEAKIVADSIVLDDMGMLALAPRLTTFQLKYPRIIHAEFMTHRVFSRNASSSRAIPVSKNIQAVLTAPAEPEGWGRNQPGMQASEELTAEEAAEARRLWLEAGQVMAQYAEKFNNMKLHKQVANRILEPWLHISVVMTTTDIVNFFTLRDHPDADPTIQALARAMKMAYSSNAPAVLEKGQWHLPYLTEEEKKHPAAVWISAARCARVSYNNHDGTRCDIEKDLALAKDLSTRRHMSPFEHQAAFRGHVGMPGSGLNGNFAPEWVQFRQLVDRKEGVGAPLA